MATKSSKSKRAGGKAEPAVVYRGIKIVAIGGTRSKTSKVLREALSGKSGAARGRPAHA